jgi:hypothetical protein
VADARITFASSETRSAACLGFEAVGASVRGPAHEATGQPCQDFFAIAVGEDWVVAVVSDGAGSAARALDGARIVSEELSFALTKFLEDDSRSDMSGNDLCSQLESILVDGIERARQRCLAEAATGQKLRSFHATVVGTVLLNTGSLGKPSSADLTSARRFANADRRNTTKPACSSAATFSPPMISRGVLAADFGLRFTLMLLA